MNRKMKTAVLGLLMVCCLLFAGRADASSLTLGKWTWQILDESAGTACITGYAVSSGDEALAGINVPNRQGIMTYAGNSIR